MAKRVILILIALLLFTFIPFLVWAADSDKKQRPALVVTTPVTKGVVKPLQTYTGTIFYNKVSELASEQEGLVSTLSVKEGQTISRGDIVVTLDSQILQANIAAKEATIEALQAELTREERDLERARDLRERNSISQSNYDRSFFDTGQLRARQKAAASELDGLRIQLKRTTIRAPFDGIVVDRNVEIGEWVGKGETVATLVAPESLEAHLNIPARYLNVLRSTDQFQATVDGHDINIRLKAIIPAADAATRTFPVRMEIPQGLDLIEGMRIDVKVPTRKEQESLMVPRDAVIKRFGQNVVFAAVDGKAVMIPVQVIGYETNLAAITGAGIMEQMAVVVKGNERIFPNMPLMEKKAP